MNISTLVFTRTIRLYGFVYLLFFFLIFLRIISIVESLTKLQLHVATHQPKKNRVSARLFYLGIVPFFFLSSDWPFEIEKLATADFFVVVFR